MSFVFVLGDSRTGTTSLHRFLQNAGYKSIHYYFKHSGVRQNSEITQTVGEETEDNWVLLKRFIDTSGYSAFSDYPTRTFFRELMENYPDAHFILTTRKDIETWQRSMTDFMGKFGFDLNIPALTKAHIAINQQIRETAEKFGNKLCEIDIDASSSANAETLATFLELPEVVPLGRENASSSYNLRLWSSRCTLYGVSEGDIVAYAETSCAPNKAMLSEHGWVYLTNDSSDYMQYLFGGQAWTESEANNAVTTLTDRHNTLAGRGILYRKFVIPEKAAVYPEYLPKVFEPLPIPRGRPAQIAEDATVPGYSYVADILKDAKSRGLVYFKGDSHTSWFGAYFVYNHIIESLNAGLHPNQRKPPIPLSKLTPSMVGYAGDIATQLSAEHKAVVDGVWKQLSLGNIYEHLVRYELAPKDRNAQAVERNPEYDAYLGERPRFMFSHPNKKLPKAIIFRDSTSDWLVDLLAEHFSESLFIWHKGQVYEDLIEREKPDVVLHIMAERFFTQYKVFPPFAQLFTDRNLKASMPEVTEQNGIENQAVEAPAAVVKRKKRRWKRVVNSIRKRISRHD
ncbi:MAG: sulfotransferase [Pseudomonadota bacterium]